jgi:copper chaperone CopZ
MEAVLKIQGLSCSHCTNAVNQLLKEIDGVTVARISLPDTAEITIDESKVTLEVLKEAINDTELYKVI